MDLSTGHHFVAPYEILTHGTGLWYFLTLDYLFDHRSFTSLYNRSLQDGWDNIFVKQRDKLKAIKSNTSSVLKCFLLNRLLFEYNQDPKVFADQTKLLHEEICERMRSRFPQWNRAELFHQVKYWRDMQSKRHLFYWPYLTDQPPSNLPSFLMIHKAVTNWSNHLIERYQQNNQHWDATESSYFTELFEHSFIIVAQPAPATHYTKNRFGLSAKINVRIICLLNPDVIGQTIQLSNIDVTLLSSNKRGDVIRLQQPTLAWQIEQIMSADNERMSIYYAEVNDLKVTEPFARRTATSNGPNLCKLEFRITVQLPFYKPNSKKPIFEHPFPLISEPFGISSHSIFTTQTVAKVLLHKIQEIHGTEAINSNMLTEYTCRYFTRMLGIFPKQQTQTFINDLFQAILQESQQRPNTATEKSPIEKILAQLIAQIKTCVDYPVLTMMYDEGLFLGICDDVKVDGMLQGTSDEPQMLLRFEKLSTQRCDSNSGVRCIIRTDKITKSCFDKKTFVEDMCRFIFESNTIMAEQTTLLTDSGIRLQHDFQSYYDDALYKISNIEPPDMCKYKPLIPVLWQLRIRENMTQSQLNHASTNSLQSATFSFNSETGTVTCTANRNDSQDNSNSFTLEIKVPVSANITLDDIMQNFKEKLEELCKAPDTQMDDDLYAPRSIPTFQCDPSDMFLYDLREEFSECSFNSD